MVRIIQYPLRRTLTIQTEIGMAHVLVSPLNWGLGHATRDIPIIKKLLDQHHEVTIAACGNAQAVLKKEFPDCPCITFPDYPVPYSSGRYFLPKFVAFSRLCSKRFPMNGRTYIPSFQKIHTTLSSATTGWVSIHRMFLRSLSPTSST